MGFRIKILYLFRNKNTLNSFSKHSAVFFLFISSFFIVPKEFLHELSFHEDTHDCSTATNTNLTISNAHRHCDILQVFISPYNANDKIFQFSEITILFSQDCFGIIPISFEIANFFVSRGPPAEWAIS